MVTSNVIQRVFQIKYKDKAGTCFAIDIDKKQYLVTAKHILNDVIANDKIEILYQKEWCKLEINLTGHSSKSDTTVISPGVVLITGNTLPATFEGIIYGQDLFFLGFPFGLKSDVGEINRNFPLPFVKKGILSSLSYYDNKHYFIIDGLNNPGFSGGPVVFKIRGSNEFQVAGIISSYQFENIPVELNNMSTNLTIKANTGLIIASNIDDAILIIKNNPNGIDIE